MPLTLTLLAVNKGIGPFLDVEALVVPSGSYVAGGDTLDLTQLYNQVDPAGRTVGSSNLPVHMEANGLAGVAAVMNNYQPHSYTNPNDGTAAVALTPATCKLMVFSGITEASAIAYTNQVLSDRIILKATFQAQQ